MAVPAIKAVPADDIPDHLVPADDMPANLVPQSDLPDHLAAGGDIPTMTIRPQVGGTDMTPSPTAGADWKPSPRPSLTERVTKPFAESIYGPDSAAASLQDYLNRKLPPTGARMVGGVLGPAATMFVDLPQAAVRAGAGGVAGLAEEAGMAPASSDRLERDLNVMGDVAGIEVGRGQITERGLMAPAKATFAEEQAAARQEYWQKTGAGHEMQPPIGTQLAAGKVQQRMDRETAAPNKAADVLEKRVNQDIAGGAQTAQGAVDDLARMRAAGKPATVLDVMGPKSNTQGLGGSVSRQPGSAQTIIKQAATARDVGAEARNLADVQTHLVSGPSAYRTTKELLDTRSKEGNPLYQKAFEGGSMAPLEKQFEESWNAASKAEKEATQAVEVAQSQLNAALAKDPVTGGNVYAQSSANEAIRTAKRNVQSAQQALQGAQANTQKIREMLRQAQEDIANDTPGAVWNPRIQQFLELPEIKKGLARGYQIQRVEAVADGEPFNAHEYALTPEGEVIRVPNMRTLNVAKKGLDAMIADERNPQTGRLTEAGVALNKLRISFLKEMDAINPDYAAARASWAGHSASLDAIRFGQNLHNLNPEEIRDTFNAMSESEQEFVRVGRASKLAEIIKKSSMGSDESKALIKSTWAKEQLAPIYRSERDFAAHVQAIADERRMYDTNTELLKGSQTASRVAEDESGHLEAAAHASHGVARLLQGHYGGAIRSAWQAYRNLGLNPDEAMTEALARMLTDPTLNPTVENGRLVFPRSGGTASQMFTPLPPP